MKQNGASDKLHENRGEKGDHGMHYLYGPVSSRRLGRSLGIITTPYKYCSLDCVYCQLKKTTKLTLERKEYIKTRAILTEVAHFLQEDPEGSTIDFITFSGAGEPLLNSKIKEIIQGIRALTAVPIAIITNATLLVNKTVRDDIADADLIVPSLDAYTQDVFEKIDRPFSDSIQVGDIIKSLIALRKEFKKQLWLEIMLVHGINDDLEYVKGFKEVIERIQPDKIQLNVVSRPPAESWVKSPSRDRLKKIAAILGDRCEFLLS